MKVTVPTAPLRELVIKAMKGSGRVSTKPITEMMGIIIDNTTILIQTADISNFLTVRNDKVDGITSFDYFCVVVPAEVFSALVIKTTSEHMTFEVPDNSNILTAVGNGKYQIELPLDEVGELVEFPDPVRELADTAKTIGELSKATVDMMVATAKSALATQREYALYTGYYIKDVILASDTDRVCCIHTEVTDEALLVGADTIDLVALSTSPSVTIQKDGSEIVFISDTVQVYSQVLPGIEDYPVEVFMNFVNSSFDGVCELPKKEFLSLIDRLSLFVSIYDRNSVYMHFDYTGVTVESKQNRGKERLLYVKTSDSSSFSCCVDIEMLKKQVSAVLSDTVTLHYGRPDALKVVEGNNTHILALMNEEGLSE